MAAPAVIVTGGAGFVRQPCLQGPGGGGLPAGHGGQPEHPATPTREMGARWSGWTLRDRAGVEAVLRRHGAQAVMHFAAFAGWWRSRWRIPTATTTTMSAD